MNLKRVSTNNKSKTKIEKTEKYKNNKRNGIQQSPAKQDFVNIDNTNDIDMCVQSPNGTSTLRYNITNTLVAILFTLLGYLLWTAGCTWYVERLLGV